MNEQEQRANIERITGLNVAVITEQCRAMAQAVEQFIASAALSAPQMAAYVERMCRRRVVVDADELQRS